MPFSGLFKAPASADQVPGDHQVADRHRQNLGKLISCGSVQLFSDQENVFLPIY